MNGRVTQGEKKKDCAPRSFFSLLSLSSILFLLLLRLSFAFATLSLLPMPFIPGFLRPLHLSSQFFFSSLLSSLHYFSPILSMSFFLISFAISRIPYSFVFSFLLIFISFPPLASSFPFFPLPFDLSYTPSKPLPSSLTPSLPLLTHPVPLFLPPFL